MAEFSTEAEYVTHAKASNEDIHLLNFLTGLLEIVTQSPCFFSQGLYDLQEALPTTTLVSILITGFHIVTKVKVKYIPTQLQSYISVQK